MDIFFFLQIVVCILQRWTNVEGNVNDQTHECWSNLRGNLSNFQCVSVKRLNLLLDGIFIVQSSYDYLSDSHSKVHSELSSIIIVARSLDFLALGMHPPTFPFSFLTFEGLARHWDRVVILGFEFRSILHYQCGFLVRGVRLAVTKHRILWERAKRTEEADRPTIPFCSVLFRVERWRQEVRTPIKIRTISPTRSFIFRLGVNYGNTHIFDCRWNVQFHESLSLKYTNNSS